jgi:hypothetical protein
MAFIHTRAANQTAYLTFQKLTLKDEHAALHLSMASTRSR